MTKSIEVVRTYLQMLSVDELKPAKSNYKQIQVVQVFQCPSSFYRYLYGEVGRNYHWLDRLGWTNEQIHMHLNQNHISLWVLYRTGAPGGYFELCQHEDGSVEIAYFGLLPEFIGLGLGKYLLTIAIEQAWNQGANRVWVHTCSRF